MSFFFKKLIRVLNKLQKSLLLNEYHLVGIGLALLHILFIPIVNSFHNLLFLVDIIACICKMLRSQGPFRVLWIGFFV